jgi:uncharacterized cupredoxin-like copper-binding protein
VPVLVPNTWRDDMRRRLLIGLATVTMVATFILPAAAGTRATSVNVRMTEFKFGLSKKTVPRGTVTFKLVNKGNISHDFKIKGKKSPLYRSGKGGVLRVRFTKPGRYRYLCTVPGHADEGMKGVLTVR